MPRPRGQAQSLYYDYPHYVSAPAPELGGDAVRHAVAIVGAGPVGLCAALTLARHGVPSVVLDAKSSVGEGSRAICIARHSVEIFQQLGVAGRFLGKALPWTDGTSYYRERPVYRLRMPHGPDERYYPMYNLQQQYIEQFLVEAVQATGRVDLRWGHALDTLQLADDEAVLEVESPQGRYRLRASYLVAADGAHSRVRQQLGLKLAGAAYEGRYVIVDVQMRSDYPTERRAFFDPVANRGATILVHRQPDDIWRIDYQLRDDEDEQEALSEREIRARVGAIVAMLGERAPWQLEWWSLYKAYTLCLEDYRHGRALFAGDAAHLVPIFGVRGLNSGLADAADLGWKLAMQLQGRAGPHLLDSYTPERRGATLDVFAQAGRSTRFMTPPTRGERLVRDAALSLAADHDCARRLLDPRQSQPYSYAASPLTTPDDECGAFAGGPRPGMALANARLDDDTFLLDDLGREFTLLAFGDAVPEDADRAALTAAARDAGIDLALRCLPAGTPAAARCGVGAGGALLVRPDRHVCARWRNIDAARLREALRRALGQWPA